ncbi:NmrA family NAD(P)-binding protein [Streptosporangium subroseum]|uniref:NAD-dependent epimerase/dehydratase family protein n=1 Tax=Streptosporangium subroseum TaxID=106412 RepID=UPI00341BC983
MKIAVTGASGKTGRAVVEDLLAHGHEVRAVDVRDVAQACRLALPAEVTGAPAYVIAAGDTLMDRPSADIAAEVFPGVPVRRPLKPYESLLSSDKARDELGYRPRESWRDVLGLLRA